MADVLMKLGLCIVKLVIYPCYMDHHSFLVEIPRSADIWNPEITVVLFTSMVDTYLTLYIGSLYCDTWGTW